MSSSGRSDEQVQVAFRWLLRSGVALLLAAVLLAGALLFGVPVFRVCLSLVYVTLAVFACCGLYFVVMLLRRDFGPAATKPSEAGRAVSLDEE